MVATLKQGATREYIQKLLDRISKEVESKGVDAHRFCGKLNIKEDGLTIQKRLRDEWE